MFNVACEIIDTLEKRGYEAYFIGGSVRNKLHNTFHSAFHNTDLTIKDYDLVTNASYEQITEIFEDTESRGAQFSVAIVKLKGYEFEVAQYRGESYPEGGSLRPDKVFPVQTLKEDVERRDFTINGIALTIGNDIIDHVSGRRDIRNKIIRTIGDPDQRFAEDPLRIMRAFRFMSQLDYQLDPQTKLGIERNLHLLNKIPHERMKEEIHKMLRGEYAITALIEMRNMKIHKHTFHNSIEDKQVPLFSKAFNASFVRIKKRLNRLSRSEVDISEIYYAMYYDVDYNEAEQELKDMMFLNEKELSKTLLMLKHHDCIYNQYTAQLHELVMDISEQQGMTYLKDIVDSYKRIHTVDFSELEELMKRPLFKSQLPFDGNDVIETGKKFNLKPGKWVGEVLDNAQKLSIFGHKPEPEFIIRVLEFWRNENANANR